MNLGRTLPLPEIPSLPVLSSQLPDPPFGLTEDVAAALAA